MSNGFKNAEQENLYAFVFENDLQNLPIQEFLCNHFKTKTLLSSSINFQIDNNRLKLLVYDTDNFERFFGSNNFTAKSQENNSNKTGNSNKFIAWSVISDSNQDCLASSNLLNQKVIQYLKSLKSKYFIYNGRN